MAEQDTPEQPDEPLDLTKEIEAKATEYMLTRLHHDLLEHMLLQLRKNPSPAVLKEIRQFLADNGINEPRNAGSRLDELAAARQRLAALPALDPEAEGPDGFSYRRAALGGN